MNSLRTSNRGPALVTGATGFVGSNVARLLLERGREVRVLVRKGSDRRNIPEHSMLRVFEGDLRDGDSVRRALRGSKEVYHVAADYRFWAPEPQEIYDSNVEGTRILLDASFGSDIDRFIHTSTVGTIGLGEQPVPGDESSPIDPGQFTSHYKKSKLQAENLALQYAAKGLPVVIVNPSTPIGPWDRKPTPTGKIIVDFMTGRLPAYVETGLNFIHVADVAQGHLLAAERGRVGERYILGHQNLKMIDFLKILSALTGRKPPAIRVPYAVSWVTGWVSTAYATRVSRKPPSVPLEAVKMAKRFMFFDSTKAVRELGLPQTSVEAAAADALKWFSQNGYFS